MHEQYHKWHSPVLNRDFEMLTFGHGGYPVILFPTSKGSYYQNKDQGLIATAQWFLEQGKVKIYCPDSMDAYSWYNKSIAPGQRAFTHTLYDRMIREEIVPRAFHETGHDKITVAGCSFGGYHAANFAFRHPGITRNCFSMSGVFDIRSFVDGYYDDNVYFNNPVDFIPGATEPALWQMGIVLGTAERDICRGQNEWMSRILNGKEIKHWLDIRPNRDHDWPVWKEMFPHYLSLLPGAT
ncbi:MAG: esterase family protein [Bacteroidetes bacterium]|nr:esterase family protein [Bacteroidota bacterium]